MDFQTFVGKVEDGKFETLVPKSAQGFINRFTTIRPMESRPPESGELQLTEYEGQIIAIQGSDQGGWIYQASVIDTASPIVAVVVEELYNK